MKRLSMSIRLLCLFLLVVAGSVQAQETMTEDGETIPYYRSDDNFNVPILGGNWDNGSTDDVALFVNDDLNVTLHMMAIDTLDATEALRTAVTTLVDDDLPDPNIDRRIGLPDGTWLQHVYELDTATVTAMALIRSDRTFVATLLDENPSFDVIALPVRTPLPDFEEGDPVPTADVLDGIHVTLETYLGTESTAEPEAVETITLDSGDWVRASYTIDDEAITIYGYQFRNFTYSVVATGTTDTDALADIANAFEIFFLGFFYSPDNLEFLLLGLAFTIACVVALLGSMYLRHRNAQKEFELVEQLTEQD